MTMHSNRARKNSKSAIVPSADGAKKRLLVRAVQKELMSVPPMRAGGCSLYPVRSAWQADLLAEELETARDAGSLKNALHDPAVPAVYIPRASGLTTELIKKICQRTGQTKNIYTEVLYNE